MTTLCVALHVIPATSLLCILSLPLCWRGCVPSDLPQTGRVLMGMSLGLQRLPSPRSCPPLADRQAVAPCDLLYGTQVLLQCHLASA
uniref:Secreted protein n=1 Tax=Knipowitschia caucasica TaxID=637954 RepID=A0AAV2L2B1_KNICA